MSLTCILIDDEAKALTSLDYELHRFEGRIKTVGRFNQASEAILFLQSHATDLVFLDVNMPGMDGMRFLEQFENQNRGFQQIGDSRPGIPYLDRSVQSGVSYEYAIQARLLREGQTDQGGLSASAAVRRITN